MYDLLEEILMETGRVIVDDYSMQQINEVREYLSNKDIDTDFTVLDRDYLILI